VAFIVAAIILREVAATKVGVRATVHALRRAFAVAFLTSHPGARWNRYRR